VPIIAFGTWPVMATIGIESSFASAIAVSRLVAPGPEVPKQTAGWPVARAMPWRDESRALLMASQDMADVAGVHAS